MGMRVYLDSNFFIRFIEDADTGLATFFRAALEQRVTLVTSELTLLEVLTGATKLDDAALGELFERMLAADSPVIRVIPIDRTVLQAAAKGRVLIGNKTPDAIHVATAALTECTIMATSDLKMRLPLTIWRCALEDLENLL